MPDKTLTFGVACLTFSAIVVPHGHIWDKHLNPFEYLLLCEAALRDHAKVEGADFGHAYS